MAFNRHPHLIVAIWILGPDAFEESGVDADEFMHAGACFFEMMEPGNTQFFDEGADEANNDAR